MSQKGTIPQIAVFVQYTKPLKYPMRSHLVVSESQWYLVGGLEDL